MLNEQELDSLIELANMAINRAAGKLSELTGQTIHLTIPKAEMLSPSELEHFLLQDIGPAAPCINQHFEGPFSGDSILIYPGDSARKLVSALLNEDKEICALSSMQRSALIEVGNILINAFMGLVAEILELSLEFSVPQMFLPSKEIIKNVLSCPENDLTRVALLLNSEMRTEDAEIIGHLAILMDIKMVAFIITRMEEIWLK